MVSPDNWEESPPEEFDRTQAVPQFKQYIFELWKRGEGPCRDCPNYAKKEKCFPAFGSGHPEAEIVLIGSSPGPREREKLEIENKNRVVDSSKLEDHDDFDGYPLTSFYGYNIDNFDDWTGFATLNKRFIRDKRGLNTDLQGYDIYFTNAKKCVNIEGRDNTSAVNQCSSYLEKEISIINPSVLISWGRQGAIGAAQAIGYDTNKIPDKSTALPTGDSQPVDSCIGYRDVSRQEPYLITMPHFSMLGPNVRHIPGFDSTEYDDAETQLYYQLADLVDYLLN